MATATTPYVYRPLSIEKAIRVAELQPVSPESPLVISLTEIPLPTGRQQQSRIKYQTLSYEWGDVTRTRQISCDGKTLTITKNLEAALMRLRSPDETLKLWIDSVCINQEDVPERSSQVNEMPLIYKSATRVFMWIGEETLTVPLALSSLHELHSAYQVIKSKLEEAGEKHASFESERGLKALCGDAVDLDVKNEAKWDALGQLFSRTYFERTWIVQEVLLSWNATVVCGSHRFPFKVLQDAVNCVRKASFVPAMANSSLAFCQLMALAVNGDMLFRVKMNIFRALQSLTFSRCRDPRDYVYAAMGMAAYPYGGVGHSDPVDTGLPPPDYKKSVETVYQETTTALIRTNGDLGVFFNIQNPRKRTHTTMPTWVIDWSASPEGWWQKETVAGAAIVYTVHDSAVHRENQACMPLFPGPVSIDGRILRAEGISLGRVHFTSRALHSSGLAYSVAEVSSQLDKVYEGLSECNTMFAKYVNGEPVHQVYVKTFLMNNDGRAASSRGFAAEGPSGWTPMYESFFGTMALAKVGEKVREEYPAALHEYIMTKAVSDLGAGLFLASAKTLGNNRVFRTSRGLLGLSSLDVEPGDEVVILKGAMAPLVLRECDRDRGEWEIVGDAYVHAAMEVNEHVYPENLCRFKDYRIV